MLSALFTVLSVQCAVCTVDWWWWARWALTRSPPCQKCHTPSYPFPNTPLLPVHSVHSAQCTLCRVAATVLTAGKMEWPQRELDCHLLLLLLLLLSAAYLLPLPTIYYLLDKSSCEEGKKVMDSVTCMMPAPEYIVGTCPKELVLVELPDSWL